MQCSHVPVGNASYSGVHGVRTLDPAGAPQSLAEDAVCAIYSMTKLMTSISAMQCVERGLIGLDDDVSTVLTSLITDVLEGFDDKGKPILRKAKNKVTLRWGDSAFCFGVCLWVCEGETEGGNLVCVLCFEVLKLI